MNLDSGEIERRRESILKKAKAGPGVEDIMKVYGRYEELATKTQHYFRTRSKRFTTINSSNS